MRKFLYIIIGIATLAWTGCSEETVLDDLAIESVDNGSDAPFQWTRAEDVETRKAFLRNFGVGYSYDAVRGAYCNWKDIRCQVINRAALDDYARRGQVFWVSRQLEDISSVQKMNYSLHDYVQSMRLDTKESIDLGLYNKEKRKRQDVMEEGLHEQYYFSIEERIVVGDQYIQPSEIMENVRYGMDKTLLTQSFQDAVEHLAWADPTDIAVVDSFVNVWGTHVITRSWLGASLRLEVQNESWRYTDVVSEQEFTTEQVMFAYKNRKDSRHDDERYNWLKSSKLVVEARGGDQSKMDNILGVTYYDGTREIDLGGIADWRMSVHFDPANEEDSNVEMVNMSVVPIWDFIEYPHVQQMVKSAIMQDVALQQELLGDRNFFSAKFPIVYNTATCQYHESTNKWASVTRVDTEDAPMVVNIVSGGRYVATVCHEQLEGHWFWVAYPIYEGKVKLGCGLGVRDDNQVFDVRWVNGTLKLSQREGTPGTEFYINGGELALAPQEGINYAESTALPYIELAGGVTPDGGYSSYPYSVTRDGAKFVLKLTNDSKPTNIVGWTYDTTERGRSIYKRNDNYVYIYNQNEIK